MSHASVKAYRHLALLLEKLGQQSPCPVPGSPWRENPPDEFPAKWARSWGEDEFGLWCGIAVQGVELRFRWIPKGTANMGSHSDEAERYDDEVQYSFTMGTGYWFSETSCTQQFWRAVLTDNPSHFKNDLAPVESVSWQDVIERFLPVLNTMIDGLEARLPSEMEWEYACRAGTVTPFWWGDFLSTELANYDGNYPYEGGPKGSHPEKTTGVFEFCPNPWGLYQMHGNVWEWCEDSWNENPLQPTGADETGRGRVVRGGSWNVSGGSSLRSAVRGRNPAGNRFYDLGFRLVTGLRQRGAPE